MDAGEQVRALTGLTAGQVTDLDIEAILGLHGVTDVYAPAPVWAVMRAAADLLTRHAITIAATPRLAQSEDLTISGPSPVELRALAADLRARADHAEEQAEADGFTLAVAEFSPYGRRAL